MRKRYDRKQMRAQWRLLFVAAATLASSRPGMAETWSDGSSNWNTPGNWTPATVPGNGDAANISEADGVSRTITYDYPGTVTLGTLTLDLTNFGGTASTILSMAANNLTAGLEYVGDSGDGANGVGTVNQSGGVNTVNVASGDGLYLGFNATDTGFYNLSASGSLTVKSIEFIGNLGTGDFNQSGGMNKVGALNLASGAGSTGSYSLSAGTLSATGSDEGLVSEFIGDGGIGNFNQTGGLNTTLAIIDIGYSAAATGTYTLSGSGALSAQIENIGQGGSGLLNQSGGSNTVSTLQIGAAAGAGGTYLYSGGALNVNNVYVGGTSSGAGGSAVLTVNQSAQLSVTGTLKVWNSGRVNLDAPSSSVGSLSIIGTGSVNLNGALRINYGSAANDPAATIVSYLTSGYNGGTWTGTSGIISTSVPGTSPLLALGYADGNVDPGTPAAANQILIQYTLAGDANLDGKVDFTDLGIVGQHLNTTGNDWAHGNFNYASNGAVNFTDLGIVGQNLNKLLPAAGGTMVELPVSIAAIANTAVPEPGESGLAVFGLYLLRRRRRNLA